MKLTTTNKFFTYCLVLFPGIFALSTTPVLAADIRPSAVNLGNISNGQIITGNIAPNAVDSFSFTVNEPFSYLDITTNGSEIVDTEIGLYDASGNLIADDDDDGIGSYSTLSLGTGSGQTLGSLGISDSGDFIANGQDGSLVAGDYFLALGEFQTVFNDNFDVESTGTDSGGDYQIEFVTDSNTDSTTDPTVVPEFSTTLGILLIGAGFGLKRRRDYYRGQCKKTDLG